MGIMSPPDRGGDILFLPRLSVCQSVCLSVHSDECILVCFKIMDSSVYFNWIYSKDTQVLQWDLFQRHTS